MHTTLLILLSSLSIPLIWTCSSNEAESRQTSTYSKAVFQQDISWVDTAHIRRGDFHEEIFSNGKLYALQRASLSFKIPQTIAEIYVKNGQRVQKGQRLAKQENFPQQLALEQAQQNLEKARTNMQDALIGYGYSGKDSSEVPSQIFKAAQNKSGYLQAQSELKKAKYDLQNTILTAPFSAIVANLTAKPFNSSEAYSPFCVLLGDRIFEAKFQILETEVPMIQQHTPSRNHSFFFRLIPPMMETYKKSIL